MCYCLLQCILQGTTTLYIFFQYGFAFGITNLAAFIASPLCAKYGDKIGAGRLITIGFYLNALSGIAFGFLIYADTKELFLGFSYILRFLLFKMIKSSDNVYNLTSLFQMLVRLSRRGLLECCNSCNDDSTTRQANNGHGSRRDLP